MPLEFIPNQPIIFEKPIGDFPCLNNDNKAYAQLLQDGDEMCIQWQLVECGDPLCEPDMVMPTPGSDLLGAWTTAGSRWTSTGSDNLYYDGSISAFSSAYQNVNPLINTVYRIRFEVTNITGTATYQLVDNNVQSFTFNSIGTYEVYFINDSNPNALFFQGPASANPADTLTIENIEVIQWTTCWEDTLYDSNPSWDYSFENGQGKFCSSNGLASDLINTNAVGTLGNYHTVSFTISNCTTGGLEVRLGSVLLGTTSGNGEFNFSGTPTIGTDLVFTKVNGFNGCVNLVSVKDFGDISNVNVTLRALDNSITGTGITANVYDDRLVACFKPENLTWAPRQPRDCELLQVDVTEPCTLTIYTSVNHIQYIKDGIPCTKLVESWNDGYAFGFYFGDVNNPDFVLRQRLRFLAFNPVYRNAGEEYLYSSGNTGRSFAQSQKARTAWFDYMDEYAHDCTRVQLLSQKLLIDDYAFYYPTEDYEPEWNERGAYNLAQSRVTLLHEEAIFGSTCGTLANAVCPPQVVNVPTVNYTQVKLKGSFTDGGFDFTNCSFIPIARDSTGAYITTTCSGGNYDLTTVGGRSAALSDILCQIDQVFGTSSSGTLTYAANTLTIDIIGSITLTSPAPVLSLAFFDTFCSGGCSPFATIPS